MQLSPAWHGWVGQLSSFSACIVSLNRKTFAQRKCVVGLGRVVGFFLNGMLTSLAPRRCTPVRYITAHCTLCKFIGLAGDDKRERFFNNNNMNNNRNHNHNK